MFDLIKSIYQKRAKSLTIMVVDAHHPDESQSFHYSGTDLSRWFQRLFWVACIVASFLIFVMVRQVNYGGGPRIQFELNQLQQRIRSLGDSVEARDQQLLNITRSLKKMDSLNSDMQVKDMDSRSNARVVEEAIKDSKYRKAEPLVDNRNEQVLQQNTPIIDVVLSTFPSSYPVKGQITRTYRPDLGHYGIDFAVREGSLAYSIGSGQVISTQWTAQFGYVVTISHYDGYILVYKHLLDTNLNMGDLIFRGRVIGRVGKIGTLSTGPHLHLEIWKNGTSLNPLPYFTQN